MRKQREGCGQGWIDAELVGCEFSDVRLNKRFRKLVEQFSGGIGASIPWACQDWANTKAAYRFLSNPQVNEAEILQGHFQATRDPDAPHLVNDLAPTRRPIVRLPCLHLLERSGKFTKDLRRRD